MLFADTMSDCLSDATESDGAVCGSNVGLHHLVSDGGTLQHSNSTESVQCLILVCRAPVSSPPLHPGLFSVFNPPRVAVGGIDR